MSAVYLITHDLVHEETRIFLRGVNVSPLFFCGQNHTSRYNYAYYQKLFPGSVAIRVHTHVENGDITHISINGEDCTASQSRGVDVRTWDLFAFYAPKTNEELQQLVALAQNEAGLEVSAEINDLIEQVNGDA